VTGTTTLGISLSHTLHVHVTSKAVKLAEMTVEFAAKSSPVAL
jgi:hypothetical protein